MHIRKFFVNLKRKKSGGASSDSDEQDTVQKEKGSEIEEVSNVSSSVTATEDSHSQRLSQNPNVEASSFDVAMGNLDFQSSLDDYSENDIGRYIGRASLLSIEKKKELLENCWTPSATYNFAEDAKHLKRKFNYSWLETYFPWLAYSKCQKGAFCKYCTLFPPNPNSFRGLLGSFIIRPFCKFKDIHEHCKKHMETHFHKTALEAAKSFLECVPVDVQLRRYSQGVIEENKKIIRSIISCITFCGSHDLPLRGKHYGEGILEGLYKLRIDAGDSVLKEHFEHGKKNASYRSVDIQNEIIGICGDIIKADIMKKVKEAEAYSVLADETADISGTEQLSIGLRYFDEEINDVQEMFVGFIELKALDAKSIAHCIDEFLTKEDLCPEKCVGLGFDGCSTMSGKDGGVQAILRQKYNKALFFHCSSHKLNLVINDLNAVPEIRNAMGTTKDIITFFRESVLRRKLIPNISRLCETRWSEKHKAIRVFRENFPVILEALETLSREGNSATRNKAFQLHAAASRCSFILSIILIAKYSALMEPVVNVLQSITLDVVKASQHIKSILLLLRSHRENPEKVTDEIIKDATVVVEKVGLEEDITSVPRIARKQHNRSNHPADNASEYWKRSLIIPYLDSVISSLEARFAEENTPSFSLSKLHPAQMETMTLENLTQTCETIDKFYNLPNLKYEIELWHQLWRTKPKSTHLTVPVVDVLNEAKTFFPETGRALKILIALPCTTCTVERSFSSLRRLKTWLRSTMGEDRLNGLALMSVHRKVIDENLKDFYDKGPMEAGRTSYRLKFVVVWTVTCLLAVTEGGETAQGVGPEPPDGSSLMPRPQPAPALSSQGELLSPVSYLSEIDSRGFHEGMFDGIGDYYPSWQGVYSKRSVRSTNNKEDLKTSRNKREVDSEDSEDIKIDKKAGGRYVRGMEMGSSGFHGDTFNSGFGDFVTMRRRRRPIDKRRPEMDQMGFHGNTFSGGFGDFETMKRARLASGLKDFIKRRPEMDAMGFHGNTFSGGFGDFDTMKKRKPEMDQMGFHGDTFGGGFGDFETMKKRRPEMDAMGFHGSTFSGGFGDFDTMKKRRPEMDQMGFHGDTFGGGFGDFETMKKRRPEMDAMGFHGNTFSGGFGDFDTMKKRRPEMDQMGFHGDTFGGGFGDFETMKKRRPEAEQMAYRGEGFGGGYGDFKSMKRRPEMTSMGFHGDTFSRGFGDFDPMKREEQSLKKDV